MFLYSFYFWLANWSSVHCILVLSCSKGCTSVTTQNNTTHNTTQNTTQYKTKRKRPADRPESLVLLSMSNLQTFLPTKAHLQVFYAIPCNKFTYDRTVGAVSRCQHDCLLTLLSTGECHGRLLFVHLLLPLCHVSDDERSENHQGYGVLKSTWAARSHPWQWSICTSLKYTAREGKKPGLWKLRSHHSSIHNSVVYYILFIWLHGAQSQ